MKALRCLSRIVVAVVLLQLTFYVCYTYMDVFNGNSMKSRHDQQKSNDDLKPIAPSNTLRSESMPLISSEAELSRVDSYFGSQRYVPDSSRDLIQNRSLLYGPVPRDVSDNLTLSESDLNEDTRRLILHDKGSICFSEGCDNKPDVLLGCKCKTGWHGDACSIPDVVFQSPTPWKKERLTLRSTPRRVVQAFPFNMEFEMLDLRFAELADVVDVFLILESNFTAYGTQKPLYLLQRFRSGMYSEFAHKILHVTLDYFPEKARKDGWIADRLLRDFIGTHGLAKISGLRSTDLFVLTDADELPCREALLFLKWHDGYTEPMSIAYQSYVFGFYWKPLSHKTGLAEAAVVVTAVCSMAMLKYVYQYHAYSLRVTAARANLENMYVVAYSKIGGNVGKWTIGTERLVAGWHCSWCLDPERIRNKLLSAQNGDFPRWGDFQEKTDIEYIKSRIARGMWFDNKLPLIEANVTGPKHLMDNLELFRHLVLNIYRSLK